MKIAIVVLSIALLIMLALFVNLRAQYRVYQEAKRTLQHTVEALQRDDIRNLIEHVERVMAGEIVYERGDGPLSRYSYNEDARNSFPTMYRIEFEVIIGEISLDGDRGEIRAGYSIRYLDSSGRMLMGGMVSLAMPAIWMIERHGEDWIIVEINEPP